MFPHDCCELPTTSALITNYIQHDECDSLDLDNLVYPKAVAFNCTGFSLIVVGLMLTILYQDDLRNVLRIHQTLDANALSEKPLL